MLCIHIIPYSGRGQDFLPSVFVKEFFTVYLWHLLQFLILFQNLGLVAGGCRSNLRKQIQIARLFGVPVVVAVNVFT